MSAETLAVDELARETVGRSENKPEKECRKHKDGLEENQLRIMLL